MMTSSVAKLLERLGWCIDKIVSLGVWLLGDTGRCGLGYRVDLTVGFFGK